MAQATLSPTTTTTSGEAFLSPLPTVRQFHRDLTLALDAKNARLRTLVGGSYRQLLGTAETILAMRKEIEDVEGRLARMGEGCSREAVGRKARGLAGLSSGEGHGHRERRAELGWSVRMKVVEMCCLEAGELLRLRRRVAANEGDKSAKSKGLVLAAKVLVLGRLLLKGLGEPSSQSTTDAKERLEEVKRKLGVLRRRLLRTVESALKSPIGDREEIIHALSAYGLATNSGARDVLRHFLNVRSEAVMLSFEDNALHKSSKEGVVKALELYARTLLDVQALVPRRLTEALLSLKMKPLIKDPSLRNLESLRLNVCDSWIGDEVLHFIPYIKHDDLEGPAAVAMLQSWSENASEAMMGRFRQTLERIPDLKKVVEIRRASLQIWIKEGSRVKGLDSLVLLEELRKVINERLIELVEGRIGKLHLVSTEIEATMSSWQHGLTDKQQSLWDQSALDLKGDHGAVAFMEAISARTYGRNDAVSRVSKSYLTWRQLVEEIIVVIQQLKAERWDKDPEEDIEDDEKLESRNQLLSITDPKLLQDQMNSSLTRRDTELPERLTSLLSASQDSDHIAAISIFILRVIRNIRAGLPQNMASSSFGLALIGPLHSRLARTVAEAPIAALSKSMNRRKVAGRALWEGEPALPVQPSPAAFRFLVGLSKSMDSCGSDLWSPAAVKALKIYLDAEVSTRWSAELQKLETSKDEAAEGQGGQEDQSNAAVEASNELVDQQRKELLIQSLFDLLVLGNALRATESKLGELQRSIESVVKLEDSAQKRLKHSSLDYWKRASLLFGLLA